MPEPAIDELFRSATLHFQSGRAREAERDIRQVLERQPNHVDAINLLGVIAGMSGQPQAAVDLISRALSLRPDDPNLLTNLATALARCGRTKESEGARNRAAAVRNDPGPLIALGELFRKHRAFDKALDCYRRAAELHPAWASAHYSTGNLLLQTGQIGPAIDALQRAAKLAPERADIQRDLGIALFQIHRIAETIDACQRALMQNADDVLALTHLGLALTEQEQLDEAGKYFQRVAELPANGVDEIFNRGVALENLDRFEDAVAEYKRAIELDPSSLSSYLNIGSALERCGQPDEALAWLDKAAAIGPNYPLVHLNRAVVLLVKGQLAEGWREHEWRWSCPQRHEPPRSLAKPLWRQQAVAGQTVLLHAEQGFGDAIQFARYAPMARQRGARVILEVQPELVELMKTVDGVDQVVARGQTLPPFDLHSPLMDLPLVFETELNTIPANVPYIQADAAKAADWADRLARGEPTGRPLLRVGLVWAGRANRAFDRTRSLTLADFAPIIESAPQGVSFISLQKGAPAEQIHGSPVAHAIRDEAPWLHDFTDTAALLSQLDLLISVDTSVAHLAGAMGRPQWILLALPADWRWLERREDSPWYPQARLFRQTQRGQWGPVIQRVAGELQNLANSKSSETR